MDLKLRAAYDAIIIGGGHNGLVAAAYLAKAGKSVLVVEKNAVFGGATASARIFSDYDAWLSRYSYLVSLFPKQIMQDLGLQFETRRRATASFTPYSDSAGQAQGLVLSNVDESRSRDSMFRMTGRHADWDRYQEFLALQAAIAKVVWPTMLKPMGSKGAFRRSLSTSKEKTAWEIFVERPLGEAIERYADHDALRGLLLTDGKIGLLTHAHDERLLQNRCFLYHVVGNETGEWRVPVGGMKSVVDALLRSCERRGVHLLASAPVVHVERAGTQYAVGFETEGQSVAARADYVLCNAAPQVFDRLMHQSHQGSPEDEGSVIKMNLLLQRLPKLKAAGVDSAEAFCGSFHVDEGYRQMETSYSDACRGKIPDPAPGEVYCHTLTDGSILSHDLQAKGYHTLTLFGLDMPWRLFEEDHDQRRDRVRELYLEGLNRLCEEPIEECLAKDSEGRPCIEIKTPQDLRSEIGLDKGNIFHNSLSWFYGEAEQVGRWGVETPFDHVYLCGSGASRGGAVSGIPGHNAAMAVLKQT